ncbi:YaaR family protein [Candidatus Riflebacteria bacterium]
MRISGKRKLEKSRGGKAVKKKDKGESQAFGNILLDSELESLEADLDQQLQKVDELGSVLARFPTAENLQNYKEKVAGFLKHALPEILKLSEKRGADLEGKQKIYFKIERIKNKIAELTENFLKKDREKFNLIEKMDEIRGLIIDLYT